MQKPICLSLNLKCGCREGFGEKEMSEPFSLCNGSWDEICMEMKSFSVHLHFCCLPHTFLTLLCP